VASGRRLFPPLPKLLGVRSPPGVAYFELLYPPDWFLYFESLKPPFRAKVLPE
jgi:hypothetical protein